MIKKPDKVKEIIINNLDILKEHSSKVVFKTGQIIFYKGHSTYGLYILTDGIIEINYNKKDSEKVNAIDLLGIYSSKPNDSHLGTAKALSPCTILFLSKNKYKEIISYKNDFKTIKNG